jgi:acetate kinase
MSSPDVALSARAEIASADGAVAVVNAGSSSIKFALFGGAPDLAVLNRGRVEGIGVAPHLKVVDASGVTVLERSWAAEDLDAHAATREVLFTARELLQGAPIAGIGHRVMHGGVRFSAPIRVDADVIAALERLTPLAPLHQPHNLAPIEAIAEAAPHIPQIACFDTAFHRTQPPGAELFGLPRRFAAAGVRRYGFHGLSYEYVAGRLKAVAPDLADGRVIVAHLGNGASLCALSGGRSVATTMGFTGLDGLVMGTRCGAVDPDRQSGLLGVSGISSDMRILRASAEPAASEAIRLFVYRVVREVGSMAAALGGLDGMVFTAGIGENDPQTRAEIAAGCAWLGLELDERRNELGQGRISRNGTRVQALVVPTDEEEMIARHTAAVLELA